MSTVNRRGFVEVLGAGALAALTGTEAGFAQEAPAPPAAGAWTGHVVKPLPYAPDAVPGISAQVISWHHGTHYAGYVKKRKQIEEQLARFGPGTAGFDARVYAGVKRDEAFNASGMVLHEVYFDNLGGDGTPTRGPLETALATAFGSLEAWTADLSAIASQATGWALLCLDPSDGRLHNYLVDAHHLGAVWGAVPIIALDVFEHAYYRDFGPDRAAYLKVFFQDLHWGRANARYAAALKATGA